MAAVSTVINKNEDIKYYCDIHHISWFLLVQVDGDRRNSLPTGGQDSVSAAMLSAANAGTGYTAFA